MSRTGSFWKRRGMLAAGLLLTLAFLILFSLRVGFLNDVEYLLYDLRMRLTVEPATAGRAGAAEAAGDVILVNIDDASIRHLGRWPWPRSIMAAGLSRIAAGSPRAVGLNVFFGEVQDGEGLVVLDKLGQAFSQKGLGDSDQGRAFLEDLAGLRASLDHDAALAKAVAQAGHVILPMILAGTDLTGEQGRDLDPLLAAKALGAVRLAEGEACPRAAEAMTPIPVLMEAAMGLGNIAMRADPDGVVRRDQSLEGFGNRFFPSFALRLAAAGHGLPLGEVRADLGRSLNLGGLRLPLLPDSSVLVRFKGPGGTFPAVSFFDVLNEKVPASLFKDKIVLVGPTAAAVANPAPTPVDPAMTLGELTANMVWSLSRGLCLEKPAWNDAAQLAAILLVGAFIALVLPRLRATAAFFTFLCLACLLLGGTTVLFVNRSLWVETAYPLAELILGYLAVLSLKHVLTETDKDKAEGESAESNRMLGLSFQGQGMLDMAFDKFRRVPVDEGMKDILYNLALDYERKRQFNKAAAVYEYVEAHDAAFKDVVERKKKMIRVGETVVLGAVGAGDSLLAAGAETRPTLGRYELVGELGRGAMGVVYKGRDPRINRVTAIKTYRFTEGLSPEEAERFKAMFFREAESAGRLSHPNIVTIYDAGEEQELAYIAMEYLEGESLQALTRRGALPDMARAARLAAQAARALDYAHERGVVHRDVKPANLMLVANDRIKITDFGIARVAATSNTQTGVVKGTPQYMSPEQIAGRKVDGRSDVFSLGVVLYQLLTGRLPFVGDNVTTLMHRIINEPHEDPRVRNPAVLKALAQIIDKALAKDPARRYQRAGQMAEHLEKVAAWLDGPGAARKTGAGTAPKADPGRGRGHGPT